MTDLWLDDVRLPEGDFVGSVWVKDVSQAILHLEHMTFARASLDHDLSLIGSVGPEGTGYDVVLWMVEHDVWPTEGIIVHSWNVPAALRMCATINQFGPYKTQTQHLPAQGLPFFDPNLRNDHVQSD
jgi:hypothetical protein